MHHVREAFDIHHLGHFYRAIIADASQVIPSQIDQHNVFSALFGIVDQFLFQLKVFFLAGAATSGAGDRAIVGDAVFEANQHLRRCAHQVQVVAEFQQEHIGRGIGGAEGAINLQRTGFGLTAEALRQHDLKGIAVADVFFRFSHARFMDALFDIRFGIQPFAVQRHIVSRMR